MLNEPLLKLDLPGIRKIKSGKVREIFDLGDRLLFVATDRISAFDCIMPNGIPRKGEVLTQISYFWFGADRAVPAESSALAGRRSAAAGAAAVLARTRAALHDRQKGPAARHRMRRARLPRRLRLEGIPAMHTVCGIKLPPGLKESAELPEPIFTPATKAEAGHDENISFEEAAKIVGDDIAEQARAASLKIYKFAREYARKRGIIIADTKFEFGLFDGKLLLIDEVLTPDSSRFWPADQYHARPQPAEFRQTIRPRLPRKPRLEQDAARARPAARSRRQNPGEIPGGLEKLTGRKL